MNKHIYGETMKDFAEMHADDNANAATLRVMTKRVDGYWMAIDALLDLWTAARERNVRTPKFEKAMRQAAIVLRNHGKLS